MPYLLMAKKRYAGKQWYNKGEREELIDCKGIETVRRDYCEIVANVVKGALKRLLEDCDRKGALEFVRGVLNDLLQDRVDLSELVITKGMSKKFDSAIDEEGNPVNTKEKKAERNIGMSED